MLSHKSDVLSKKKNKKLIQEPVRCRWNKKKLKRKKNFDNLYLTHRFSSYNNVKRD